MEDFKWLSMMLMGVMVSMMMTMMSLNEEDGGAVDDDDDDDDCKAISLRIQMKAWPTTTGYCQGQTVAAKPLFLPISHSDHDRHHHYRHYLVKEL